MLFSYCWFQPNRIRCQRDEHSTLKLLLYLMMMQLIIQSFPGIFIHILYELINPIAASSYPQTKLFIIEDADI